MKEFYSSMKKNEFLLEERCFDGAVLGWVGLGWVGLDWGGLGAQPGLVSDPCQLCQHRFLALLCYKFYSIAVYCIAAVQLYLSLYIMIV